LQIILCSHGPLGSYKSEKTACDENCTLDKGIHLTNSTFRHTFSIVIMLIQLVLVVFIYLILLRSPVAVAKAVITLPEVHTKHET
jgi:hypothetical protein